MSSKWMVMNKRDFSPDKQLLRKIERRFVIISMCAGTQKTANKRRAYGDGWSLSTFFISRLKTSTACPAGARSFLAA
jgi:hypothetical protein